MEVYGGMDTHNGGVWRDGHSQWRCMEGWTLTVEVYGGMDTHSGGVWRDGHTVEVYGGMDTHSGGVWRDGHSQWRCMEGWTLTVEVYGEMDTHSGGVWRDGHEYTHQPVQCEQKHVECLYPICTVLPHAVHHNTGLSVHPGKEIKGIAVVHWIGRLGGGGLGGSIGVQLVAVAT